jgi:hypothetical protein
MPLPELVAARVKRRLDALCERVPPGVRHQVRLVHETRGNGVTLVETRARFDDPGGKWTRLKIAKLVFDPQAGEWTLYWFDRNERRRPLPEVEPTRNLDQLLDEIDRDRHGVFWG